MLKDRNGSRFGVPLSRRLSWDLLVFHHSIPMCSHDRRMDLSAVAEARAACSQRVSWPALFVKAFALVAADVPELRQTWYRWPWAHLYQHPSNVAAMTVHREVNGEPWLFWGMIRSPEQLALMDLQNTIDQFRVGDVRKVFSKQWQLAHLPTVFRRMVWWWNLNVETRKRATRVGTFFLSTLASRGAEIQLPPSVQTGCLTYGPLDENQVARVTLAYDHRVMDGALVAEILQRLESTLNETLVQELKTIGRSNAGEKAA